MEALQTLLMSTLSIILILFQLGICIYYFDKSRSSEGILLIVGSGIHVFTSVLYSMIPILMRNGTLQVPYSNINIVYILVGIVGFIGTIAFLIGLFLLIRKVLEQNEAPRRS